MTDLVQISHALGEMMDRICTHLILIFVMATMQLAQASVDDDAATLFDFAGENPSAPWFSMNDGVMGGLSQGAAVLSEDGMIFSGFLSLENNGGFASVRQVVEGSLAAYSGIFLKVRGDGRTYQFRLESDAKHRGVWPVSFVCEFETEPGEWTEVRVPFDRLDQRWRGRVVSGHTFNAADIRSLGILLGDKRQGAFRLEVAQVGAYR